MLKAGDKAPDFSLTNEQGELISLRDYRGRTVVVYFYPRDNTPGCTKEACGLRDAYTDIRKSGAVVLGISADSQRSHANFKAKHLLPYSLLSDPQREAIQAFGAWGPKKSRGKSYEGLLRSTFVVDSEGSIIKVFDKVKPATHGAEVLDFLKALE